MSGREAGAPTRDAQGPIRTATSTSGAQAAHRPRTRDARGRRVRNPDGVDSNDGLARLVLFILMMLVWAYDFYQAFFIGFASPSGVP